MTAQHSPEWYALRLGRITASRVNDVLAVSKRDGKPLQARQDYAEELVIELLTGQSDPVFETAAMRWGTEQEPFARAAYEAHVGDMVEEVGFVVYPDLDFLGASPDGLRIGIKRGLEIKCPGRRKHLQTLLYGMPEEHIAQVQIGMACTGLAEWDFVSFDPRWPEPLQLHVETIKRDDAWIERALDECQLFWTEVAATAAAIKSLRGMK
jgi:putative phage-type endonuclease